MTWFKIIPNTFQKRASTTGTSLKSLDNSKIGISSYRKTRDQSLRLTRTNINNLMTIIENSYINDNNITKAV